MRKERLHSRSLRYWMSSFARNVKLSSEEHSRRIRRARQAEWNSSFRAPAYVKADTMIVGGIGVCLRFAGVNLLGSIDRGSLGESRPEFQGKMKNSKPLATSPAWLHAR